MNNLIRAQLESVFDGEGRRWFGDPVSVVEDSPEALRKLIPQFERRPFSFRNPDPSKKHKLLSPSTFVARGENELTDLIVRLPLNKEEFATPVAAVSKTYKLIQHTDLFEQAYDALESASVDVSRVFGELTLSAYGSKMALTFTLPNEFDFDPGDGHVLNLSLQCVNSVDGRCRLRIMLGWFRFICGNGLVVGTARLSQRFIHNEFLELPNLKRLLTEGLKSAEAEKKSFVEWLGARIEPTCLIGWIDGPLREGWGPLAAARVYLICETGQDGHFAKAGEQAPPHCKSMVQTCSVPGAAKKAENAYHVAQALAWIARSRRDVQDQLEWMLTIPDLMKALLAGSKRNARSWPSGCGPQKLRRPGNSTM
jgi:hypothetical protein